MDTLYERYLHSISTFWCSIDVYLRLYLVSVAGACIWSLRLLGHGYERAGLGCSTEFEVSLSLNTGWRVSDFYIAQGIAHMFVCAWSTLRSLITRFTSALAVTKGASWLLA